MTKPSVSVVIPTRDTRDLTLRCLSSLAGGGAAPVEVVVVDDASSDDTAEAVRAAPFRTTVVESDSNLGFSGAVNLGVEHTSGDIILLLNSDTEVLEGSLAVLVAAFSDHPKLGIGGAELLDPDGSPQWRGGGRPGRGWLFLQASGLGAVLSRLPGRRMMGGSGVTRSGPVDWVTGAAMAVRREVWQHCGPLDVGYRFYCQDLDLCVTAASSGWEVTVVAGFTVLHHHGATIGAAPGASGAFHPELLWTDLVRFSAKHEGLEAAARAAAALRAGARLRLAGRALSAPFAADRDRFNRETAAFRAGLNAL